MSRAKRSRKLAGVAVAVMLMLEANMGCHATGTASRRSISRLHLGMSVAESAEVLGEPERREVNSGLAGTPVEVLRYRFSGSQTGQFFVHVEKGNVTYYGPISRYSGWFEAKPAVP
jgi:hypothetical protein